MRKKEREPAVFFNHPGIRKSYLRNFEVTLLVFLSLSDYEYLSC